MKILYVGNHNPNYINTSIYRERAIMSLAHELVFFDDRAFLIPGRIRQKVPRLHQWDIRRLNDRLVREVRKGNPDICLMVGGYRVLPEALSTIRGLQVRTILWTTDAPIDFAHILKTAPLYDDVFCAGTEAVDLLRAGGVKRATWLPFACDPDCHKPTTLTAEERNRYARDVVFVGAYYPNRWAILKELSEFNLAIWGPDWNKVIRERNAGACITDAHLDYSEWVKIYGASKIVIVIHYQDGTTPCCQASPKVYEALACGAFVLVDRQKDVFLLFEDGTHLAGFDNASDLKEKIRFYLRNENERRTIAARGRAEVLARHTYVHRIREMLSALNRELKMTNVEVKSAVN